MSGAPWDHPYPQGDGRGSARRLLTRCAVEPVLVTPPAAPASWHLCPAVADSHGPCAPLSWRAICALGRPGTASWRRPALLGVTKPVCRSRWRVERARVVELAFSGWVSWSHPMPRARVRPPSRCVRYGEVLPHAHAACAYALRALRPEVLPK